jgi:hypothetical protein
VSELVRIPFQGDELLTTEVDGKPHIILKPAFDALGLDAWSQIEKLRSRSWACTSQTLVQLPGDRQRREVVTADVRTFLMLLATIDERRIAEPLRDKLIAYQSEVADAITAYWTEGGAINPRANDDQLILLADRAASQARVLRLLDGIVDPAWLEAKARHVAARALGEEPEIDPATRPLTVGEYLEERGITGKAQRSLASGFGKSLKRLYQARYQKAPQTVDRFVDGALRKVASYTEAHRPLFDRVWTEFTEQEKAS